MLWECSECGAITECRSRVCANCGTVTRYMPAGPAEDVGREVGSLREFWLSEGASRASPPPLTL